MPIPIAEAVEKLRASTKRLNQATDELSHVVKLVEVFLEANNVGCFTSVIVSEEASEHGSFYTELAYSKIGKSYRICIRYSSDIDPENNPEKPWSDSSREEKLATAPYIPALIVALSESVGKQEQRVKETTANIKRELEPLFQAKVGASK